ncbi:SDR family oxidoreductase [Nocardioides pantholopis]|uniref:SDR family oxidoreductase n=1 Tax=Nocardioides pantholopis TaxID=2483798 RepID=UPI0013E39C8F|nr:SDR family NAD(P)-dependent oxidoreductase [Nocardioides pantholopis]
MAPTVLVTGGGTGLGAATARLLASRGYDVHVAGRTAATLETVVAGVVGAGGRAQAHLLDVRDAEACAQVVADVVAGSGRLDVLVNNAGVFRRGTATTVTAEDWDQTLGVNLTGALHAAQAAVRQMCRQSPQDGCRGQVLNINSGAGLRGYEQGAAYSASKFGLLGLSDALRQEVGPSLVKVTDVVVATAVESVLSGRTDLRRLPADAVARVVADVLAMPGAATISRVDLTQLEPEPAPDPELEPAPERAGRA